MKKIISILLATIMLFSLSACGKKEPEPIPEPKEKVETPPFTEISNLPTEGNVIINDPFESDALLDRYEDILYYFNYRIGFYTTDPEGTKKTRLKVLETDDFVFFNTPNRINRTDKYGNNFINIVTRTPYEQIELLFSSSDWIYYKVKNIDNEYKYYKYNNSGTSKEVLRNEIDNIGKIISVPDYFYPKQLDSKILPYEQTYRSRKNNFSITFPTEWNGNYEIIDEEDLFIVKFKSRVSDNINYEFFRIKKAKNNSDWLPEIPLTNQVFYNKNGKYIIGRYEDYLSPDNIEYGLIKDLELFIPSIIYSLN